MTSNPKFDVHRSENVFSFEYNCCCQHLFTDFNFKNLIKDAPVTSEDICYVLTIDGPDPAMMKEKATRSQNTHLSSFLQKLTSQPI